MKTLFTPTLGMYLCTISAILNERNVARIRDIARNRKVKPPTASNAVMRLSKLGLVNYEIGEFIVLTEKGKNEVITWENSIDTLNRLFHDVLHMDYKSSKQEAEKLAFHVSKHAEQHIKSFLKHQLT